MQYQYLPSDQAQLQVDNEDIKRKQQMAQAFQQAGFNPVQGGNQILSLIASMASTLRGNSLMKDASKSLSENLTKEFEMRNQADQAKAEAEQRTREEDFQRELQKLRAGEQYKAEFREPEKVPFEQQLFNMLPENLRGQAAMGKFGLGPKTGPGPSETDRKVEQLRKLGATDDQIRGMLLGGQGRNIDPLSPEGIKAKLELSRLEQSQGPQEVDPRASAANDALRFVAATTGTPIETLKNMTPEQVAEEFQKNSTVMANPILGSLPGAGMTTNAIIKEMAAKQARVNNPKGTVTDADFKAAEAGLPALNRPDAANAEIIRNMLTQATQSAPTSGASEQPPVQGAKKAPDGHWYVEQNGKFARVDP